MSIIKSFSFQEGEIRGDMFYIKHNSQNFTVIDCYLKDSGSNARKQEIIEEIIEESKGRICRFISTHPDKDHIYGISDLNNKWPILNFYAVKNQKPLSDDDDSVTYRDLLKNKNFEIKAGITRAWLNEEKDGRKGAGINFKWPVLKNEYFKKVLKTVAQDGKDVNDICPIITYSNSKFKYMWMGDLSTDMQKQYYNDCKGRIPKVDVLFHPHHGRESGKIPDELIEVLDPTIIVIGNAPSEHINYCFPEKTITRNSSGDIMFINEGNALHVYSKNTINNPPATLKRVKDKYRSGWNYIGSLIK